MDSTEQLTSASTSTPSSERPSRDHSPTGNNTLPSRGRTVILISALNCTVLVGAMNTGMMTVGLPQMTVDLHLSLKLQLW